ELYVSASLGQYVFRDFNDGGNDFSGNRLPGVPQAEAGSGFTLASKIGFYISADFLYVGEMPLDDANSGYNDAYRLLDLEAGWKLDMTKSLSARISAGINNALDEHYA